MKLNALLLSLSIVLLTTSGFSKSNFNTEDYRIGHVSIENRLQVKSNEAHDKKMLRAEKKSYRLEKRFNTLSFTLNKRLAKGSGEQTTTGKTSMSLLSMIFGTAGFLFLFLPYIGILGIVFGAAGLVLGLVSLKKEGSNVFNILGIVFGGLTMFFFLLAVIIVASLGF